MGPAAIPTIAIPNPTVDENMVAQNPDDQNIAVQNSDDQNIVAQNPDDENIEEIIIKLEDGEEGPAMQVYHVKNVNSSECILPDSNDILSSSYENAPNEQQTAKNFIELQKKIHNKQKMTLKRALMPAEDVDSDSSSSIDSESYASLKEQLRVANEKIEILKQGILKRNYKIDALRKSNSRKTAKLNEILGDLAKSDFDNYEKNKIKKM